MATNEEFRQSVISHIQAILTEFRVLVNSVLEFIGWIGSNVMPVLAPVLEALLITVTDVISGILSILSGVIGFLTGVFTQDWEKAFNGIRQIISGFSQVINGACNFIQYIFGILDSWLMNVFTQDWNNTFGILGDIVNGFMYSMQQIWNGIKEIFNGIVTFIKGVFTGNWRQAWEGVKKIFKGIWDTFEGIVKAPINGIIGLINGLISGITSGINGVINALNKLSFTIPDWVPEWGGKTFGLDISHISIPKIPYLASGAVIPPNREFLAVLGDQKSGNNLEMPENLLRRIIREESGRSGGASYQFIGQINRRVLFDEFITEAKLRQSATGRNPLELA